MPRRPQQGCLGRARVLESLHAGVMVIKLPQIVTVSAYGYDALRPEIRAGELAQLRPGAYMERPPEGEPGWKRLQRETLARCVAVAEKLTTPFAFTDITAAMLRGWHVPMHDSSVHIAQTVNPGSGCASDIVRHVCPSLETQEIEWIAGLPVSGPEPTILTCARRLNPDDAFVVVDSAFGDLAKMSKFRRGPSEARQAELRASLERRLRMLGPARGVRSAREVIALADGFCEWPGESRMRWVALAGGLPVPTCQLELWVEGKQYFADAAWHGTGPEGPWLVITEFDGDVKYRGAQGADAVVAEKVREDAIRHRHHAEFARLDTATVRRPALALSRILEAFPPGTTPPLQPRRELQVRPAAEIGDRRRDR